MALKKVDYNSRIAEVDTVSGQMDSAYKKENLDGDSNLAIIIDDIRSTRTKLEVAIQQTNAESVLAENDIVRDDKYRAISYIVMGATYNPAKMVKKSALFLQKIFDKYGLEVANMSYNEESSFITNLIAEYKTPEAIEKGDKVAGFAQALVELDDAQADFDTAASNWKTDKGNDKAEISASKIRKELVTLINSKFIPYLDVMQMVNGDIYGSFATAVAEIINDNNENVKKRASQGGSDE